MKTLKNEFSLFIFFLSATSTTNYIIFFRVIKNKNKDITCKHSQPLLLKLKIESGLFLSNDHPSDVLIA